MNEPKKLDCANCGITLGYRDCDRLIVDGFTIEFKRPHKIECNNCGRHTTFQVSRSVKVIDRRAEIG